MTLSERDLLATGKFYRAVLCIARPMLSQDVRLSVRHTLVFYRNG